MSRALMGEISTGSVIGNKYRLGPVLGRGGMGVVREASHVRLGTKFAVKLLHEAADQLDRSRFEREALAASALHNRHVVRVFDVGETAEGTPYMVMELLRGRDVLAVYREETQIDTERVVDWMIQVCSAMYEAHNAGIVHRDLKPSNLFLAEAGNQELVKVVDFGISKVLSAKELTVQSSFVGTPQYMAPEQLRGESGIDHRADLWAIGVIAYRLLARQYPFETADDMSPIVAAIANLTAAPTPLSVHRPDLAPELVAAIMRALSKDRAERFADARAMALALAPHGTGSVSFEETGAGGSSDLLGRLREATPMFTTVTSTDVELEPTRLESIEAVPVARSRKPLWIASAALLSVCGLLALWVTRSTQSPPPVTIAAAPASAPALAASLVGELPVLVASPPVAEPSTLAAPSKPSTPPRPVAKPQASRESVAPPKSPSLPTHL